MRAQEPSEYSASPCSEGDDGTAEQRIEALKANFLVIRHDRRAGCYHTQNHIVFVQDFVRLEAMNKSSWRTLHLAGQKDRCSGNCRGLHFHQIAEKEV